MKLYLHWLRHDLRRFHQILIVWTLLVVAYAVFLGWLHLNILTVEPQLLDKTFPAALVLGVAELGCLFAIFRTDPAVGPHHFWKTRPPSALTIAAVKLTLALTFFLVLPLLAWGLMNLLCVPPDLVTGKSETGLSWTAFLFLVQSLIISAFLFAAARARSSSVLYLRIPATAVPAAVAGLVALTIFAPLPYDIAGRTESWLLQGLRSVPMGVLTLSAAVLLFLVERCRRVRRGSGVLLIVLTPILALITASLLHTRPPLRQVEEHLPAVDPEIAARLQIKQYLSPQFTFQKWAGYDTERFPAGPGHDMLTFRTPLQILGLPAGVIASSRWMNLRLRAPDGIVAEGNPALTSKLLNWEKSGDYLSGRIVFPEEILFDRDVLAFPPLSRCTMTGTLRLVLHFPREFSTPIADGAVVSCPLGRIRLDLEKSDFRADSRSENLPPEFRNFFLGRLSMVPSRNFQRSSINAVHPAHADIHIGYEPGLPTGVFLLQERFCPGYASIEALSIDRKDRNVPPGVANTEAIQAIKAIKASLHNNPPFEGWNLQFNWSEPTSFVDIPVTIPDVIPPTSRTTGVPQRVSEIHISDSDTPEKVESDLRYAVGLLSLVPVRDWNAPVLSREKAGLQSWRGFLRKFHHPHLPVLLDMYAEIYGYAMISNWLCGDLIWRIRELIQPEDMPALRARFQQDIRLREIIEPSSFLSRPPPLDTDLAPASEPPTGPGKPAQ